jgi:C4-dicarboxylate-specific signal transduction histidine kinase
LKENKAYSFFNLLDIGLIILNKRFEIVFWNQWISDHININLEEVRGSHFERILTEQISERLKTAVREANEIGNSTVISEKLHPMLIPLYTNGVALSYKMLITPFTYDDGPASGNILVQIIDKSQLRDREDFLKRKQKEVDKEREKNINLSRLASLGEMSSGIAHEINNPLAILSGGNRIIKKLLAKNPRDLKDEAKLNKILNENDHVIGRITKIINGMRNISRSGSGEDFIPTTFAEIMGDISGLLREKMHVAMIDFNYHEENEIFQTAIPMMRVQMSQVFVNLINNAIFEANKYDIKWIQLGGEMTPEHLIIHITDSGPGIPEEVAVKLFTPFFTTKEIGQGTGLGLSTCYKIMELHHGSITIDKNCPNTRFLIKIPLKQI